MTGADLREKKKKKVKVAETDGRSDASGTGRRLAARHAPSETGGKVTVDASSGKSYSS